MFKAFSVATIFVLALAMNGATNCASLGLNIYGLSHHFLEEDQSRKYLSEVNPGLGLRGTWCSGSGHWTTLEMGMYRDTFRNTAKYATVGYHFKTWGEVRIGINFGLYSSESIKHDETIPVAIPTISYHAAFCTLNIVYLPKFRSINPYNTLGTYLTVSLASHK